MSSLVQQDRKELDKVPLQKILDDDSLTLGEKAISIKSIPPGLIEMDAMFSYLN